MCSVASTKTELLSAAALCQCLAGAGGAKRGWEPSTGWALRGSQLPQAVLVGLARRSLHPGRSSPSGKRPACPSISSPATSGGDGVHTLGTASIPMSGLHPPADTTQLPLCTKGRLFPCTGRHNLGDVNCRFMSPCPLTRLPQFPASQPITMATSKGSRASFGPQHLAKSVATHSHSPSAHSESHDTPSPNCLHPQPGTRQAALSPHHPAESQPPLQQGSHPTQNSPAGEDGHRGRGDSGPPQACNPAPSTSNGGCPSSPGRPSTHPLTNISQHWQGVAGQLLQIGGAGDAPAAAAFCCLL